MARIKNSCILITCLLLLTVSGTAQYWHPAPGQIAGVKFTGISAHPFSSIVVVSTHKNGIYRSTDSGASWQQVYTTTDSIFALLSIDGRYLCAGGKGFTYTSADSGASWTKHTFPFHVPIGIMAMHPSGALMAATGNLWDVSIGSTGKGVWQSLDSGQTWSALNNGITKTDPIITALAVDASGVMYIGIHDGNVGLNGKHGIMKLDSINGTWQRVSIAVKAPFNQDYADNNLRVESVFNINIIDDRMVTSIAGAYINFGYAFTIQKQLSDIGNTSVPWNVKWVLDSIPAQGSFYEHIVNLFKDSHDTVWASVSGSSNEIHNNIFTGDLNVADPWNFNMDSITEQTGRFLFAEGNNEQLFAISYFTGDTIFVRSLNVPTATQEANDAFDFNIYPNPARDYVRLQMNTGKSLDTKVTFINSLGTQVKIVAVTSSIATVDVSEWAPGMYFYTLQRERAKLKAGKFIVR